MTARDMQKKKVYVAEEEAFLNKDYVSRYESVEEMQAVVDKVMGSKWLVSTFGEYAGPKVIVKKARKNARSGCVQTKANHEEETLEAFITIPKSSWFDWYLLHELAHVITGFYFAHEEKLVEGFHGRSFVRITLFLVGKWINMEAKKALRDAYLAHEVKWMRTRGLTDAEVKKYAKASIEL